MATQDLVSLDFRSAMASCCGVISNGGKRFLRLRRWVCVLTACLVYMNISISRDLIRPKPASSEAQSPVATNNETSARISSKKSTFPVCATPHDATAVVNTHSIEHPRCAILFFGLPRLFNRAALPSIKKYILCANPTCEIFVHTYNVTSTASGTRSNEVNGTITPTDVYKLFESNYSSHDHKSLKNNVVVQSMDEFYSQRNLSFYRKHHHYRTWGPCCDPTDNMIKQWHSINTVWELMEINAKLHMPKYQNDSVPYYQRIGLFRLDVLYTHPIDIISDSSPAVLPNFLFNGLDNLKAMLNDRMFYGDYVYAKVWASERFNFVPSYIKTFGERVSGFRQGLHSESFMFTLMRRNKVPYVKKRVCFWRVRASGLILAMDCKVPTLESTGTNATQGATLDEESWTWLEGLLCCWNCTEADQTRPEPCTLDRQMFYLQQ